MGSSTEFLPPAVRVLNEHGASDYVLVCEHASRFIPKSYEGLGLPESELVRHIAWDIGAADVAERLSATLDAPLVLAGFSRLLIDLNRPTDSATSIPEIGELTRIPGNIGLTAAERVRRIATYFTPFQARVGKLLDARLATGRKTIVIGVHSFTPVFKGVPRPWRAGVLFRGSEAFGLSLVEALGGEPERIAANRPYRIETASDYTVPVHGEARGLDAVLLELRQDLVASPAGAEDWAGRIAGALAGVLGR